MQQELQIHDECEALPTACSRSHPLSENKIQNKSVRVQRVGNNKNKCSGFTLLEITSVFLAIGMLLGGVLKAQGITDTSRAYNLEDDFKNIPVYINEYQGKFNAYPGDDPTIGSVNSHLEKAVPCTVKMPGKCMTGNGTIDGKWNDTTSDSESYLFWQHIRLAGLASGETDIFSPNYLAKNAAGGTLGVTNQVATPIFGLKGGLIICSDGIAGKLVKQIDLALDDGGTASGSMMATVHGTAIGGTAIATDLIVDDTLYLVCMGI